MERGDCQEQSPFIFGRDPTPMSDDLKKWKSIEERLGRGERELDSLKREMKEQLLAGMREAGGVGCLRRLRFFVIRKRKRSQESLSMKTFLGVGVLSPRRSEALTTNSQPSKRLVMCGIRISIRKLGSCGSSASRHDGQQKRASSLTLHSAASRRSSVVPAHPKSSVMPFTSKAREIHDYIVSSCKADTWIRDARTLV